MDVTDVTIRAIKIIGGIILILVGGESLSQGIKKKKE